MTRPTASPEKAMPSSPLPIPTWCLIAGMRVPHVPNAAAWIMKTPQTLTRARRSCSVSGKRFALDGGESLCNVVCERARFVDKLVGERTCALEEFAVPPQMGELQVGQSRLARTEQLSASAQLEVDLCELESVGRAHERFEPCSSGIGQLFACARDQ